MFLGPLRMEREQFCAVSVVPALPKKKQREKRFGCKTCNNGGGSFSQSRSLSLIAHAAIKKEETIPWEPKQPTPHDDPFCVLWDREMFMHVRFSLSFSLLSLPKNPCRKRKNLNWFSVSCGVSHYRNDFPRDENAAKFTDCAFLNRGDFVFCLIDARLNFGLLCKYCQGILLCLTRKKKKNFVPVYCIRTLCLITASSYDFSVMLSTNFCVIGDNLIRINDI